MVRGVELPGMMVGLAGSKVLTHRAAPNVWWLALADDAPFTTDVLAKLYPTTRPSDALAAMESALLAAVTPQRVNVLVAKLELDVCGAWLTVANGCTERPVVVRRAGWVDLRGHPGQPLGGSGYVSEDDRVGLGPADVLVLRLGAVDGDGSSDDQVIDACCRLAGEPADVVASEVRQRVGGEVLALGVPADLGADPITRVAAATGVAVDEVQSPGYPLGDLQPDLWQEPPRPPRLARLRLSADRRGVATVRSLLDRLLGSWRLDGRVDPDDVKLVATELATNAVVHGKEPETVTVRYLGDVVRIEVVDRSAGQPALAVAPAGALGGRGLHLVETLGSAWGSESLPDGKRVWCDLDVSEGRND